MNSVHDLPGLIGVVIPDVEEHAWELLGDAADLAERLHGRTTVCTTRDDAEHHSALFARGADQITVLIGGADGPNHRLTGVASWSCQHRPRVVFAGAGGKDRTLAARLATLCDCQLVSPALSVTARRSEIEITGLTADGRRARQLTLADSQSAIVALRRGVGQARPPRIGRTGDIQRIDVDPQRETIIQTERRPADPATTDIVHLPRLVSGGRGVGGREGFEFLRRVAARLDAGVAASRIAVDLGWIERERQVGQTGKSVHPELYLACGISGASHHRQGMAESKHIIALNLDPAAPIFQIAHLGLVADWRETLRHFLELTDGRSDDSL